ncbi:MAG TPA: ribulose bisphosphate carboxylase small subunit [Gemmatimonadales bacterium]|nr:ribulose bisphosphate carboxylase small subunit [Gemmatimonadales bacterium]
MRITQGTFSYLPDLTDDQIKAQIQYCIDNGWAMSVEHTDDPHPRNAYWDMYGLPMFDLKDPAAIMLEVNNCRKTFPNHYIKLSGYNSRYTKQTTALSFIVNRPAEEPGFRLERQESNDRVIRYTLYSYATGQPAGQRYGEGNGTGK